MEGDGKSVCHRVDLHMNRQAVEERRREKFVSFETQECGEDQDRQQSLRTPAGGHSHRERVQQPEGTEPTGRLTGQTLKRQDAVHQDTGE